jgi:hypothetical protein
MILFYTYYILFTKTNATSSSQSSLKNSDVNNNNTAKIMLIIPKTKTQDEVETYARLLFDRKIKSFERLQNGPCIIEYDTYIGKHFEKNKTT